MKKLLSIVVIAVMLISCMSITAFAYSSGNEVTIEFTTNDTGYACYEATINYDKDAFTLTSIESGSLYPDGSYFYPSVNNAYVIYAGTTNITSSGVLFKATFTVNSSAKKGQTYEITATVTEGSVADSSDKDAVLNITGGSITIDECKHKNTETRGQKDASCEDAGYTGDTWCKDCENKIATGSVIPAKGHDYESKVTTPATCTEKGVKTYTCQNAPSHTYTEEIDIDPTAHDWDDGVVTIEPTCTEKGVKTFTCKNNSSHTYIEDINAKGHNYGDDGKCTECGEEKPSDEKPGDDPTPPPSDPSNPSKPVAPSNPGKPSKPVAPSNPGKPSTPTEPTEPTDPLAPYLPYIDGSEESTLPFTDVKPGDWFYDDVAYVYGTGLMNGVSSNEFAPLSETTRGMIVTILWRMEGQPAPANGCQFNDVASGSYYEQAIAWAAENGIVTGISDTEFCPNNNITREQFAAILYRYAGYKGYDTSCSDAAAKAFADYGTISGYAVSAMEWACDVGLINGISGKLEPTGYTTRAQAAAILHRFCENIAK